MLNTNKKAVDIIFYPGESIKIEDVKLDLDSQNPSLRYQFRISLSLKEGYETTIYEAGTAPREDNDVKAFLSSNNTKQYKLTIFSKKIDIFPGAHPLVCRIEKIKNDYQKDRYVINGLEYRERIRLEFKVIALLTNFDGDQLTLDHNFCYDLYLDPQTGTDSTLIIEALDASFIGC